MRPNTHPLLTRGLAAILLVWALAWAQAASAQVERIAAVVNDTAITQTELQGRVALAMAASGLRPSADAAQRLTPQVLRALIDEHLQVQEAERLGVTVSNAEIERAIASIAQQNNVSPGRFLQMLQQSGVPQRALQTQVEASLLWRGVVQQRIVPAAQVSEAEIEDELRRAQAAQGQPEYLLSEIFLAADPARDAEIRAFANQLVEQIRTGANFPAIAAQFSQNASAAQGGDLGWVLGSHLSPELAQAVTQLSPGQVSTPIRSNLGYHILVLRQQRPAYVPDPLGAEVQLARLIVPYGSAQPTQALAEQKLAETRTALIGVNGCEALRQVAARYGTEDAFDAGAGTLGSLPDALRNLVANLPVGAPSDPVTTPEGVASFMICDRVADQGLNREQVRTQILNERVDLMQQRYLRDLRNSAFIDIRI